MINGSQSKKKKLVAGKGSSTSRSIETDTSELRRSTRETTSKQLMTSSPSSGSITRKSIRLEKRTPITRPLKSKPEGVEKLTPLRRSDRGKKQENSSSSSGSKKSEKESASMNSKQTRENIRKSVRRLMAESPEISRSSRPDDKPVGGKRKRMNSRMFKAIFKTQAGKGNVAGNDELEGSDKSLQDESDSDSEHVDSRENDGNETSQQIGEESGEESSLNRSDSANEKVQNNIEVELSDSSHKHSEPRKTSDADSKEASKEKLVDSTWVVNSTGCGIQYKRKRSKIGNQNNDEAAKRLKSMSALNNSVDVESSKIRRDHDSQKEDPRVDNNTTSKNNLSGSPICKVYDSMKYSRGKSSSGKPWRDKEVLVLDDSPEVSGNENDGEKQKKTVVPCSDSVGKKSGVETGFNPADVLNANNHSSKPVSPTANSFIAKVSFIEPEERTTPSIEQTSFTLLLKRKISRLSEVLKLSEDLKAMALRFLDYVIENHHVNKEPGTILQAFVISLCWIAASLLKQKVDKEESLSLARKHLGFMCKEEEANSVYSKLKLLKKKFRQKIQVPLDARTNDKMTNVIKSPQRKFDERMTSILQNQQKVTHEFQRSWEEKTIGLLKNHKKLESDFVHIPERRDKLKILNDDLAKKMEEHKKQKEISLKDLKAKQLGERNDERLKGNSSAADVPSGTPNLVVDLRFEGDETATMVLEKESTATIDSTDLSKSEELLPQLPDAVVSELVVGSGSVETVGPAVESDQENGRMGENGYDAPDSTTNKNDDVTSSKKNDDVTSSISRASPSAEPLLLPGDSAETDQSNHEGQISSQNADVAASQLPLPSELTHIPPTEGQILSESADVAASVLAEGPTVVIAQDVIQTEENSELNSLTNSTEIAQDHSQPDSQPIEEPRSVVGPTEPVVTQSISNAETIPDESADFQNQASSQNGVNVVPTTRGFNNSFPLFMEPQSSSRMTTLPLYTDPLQNELDSIRRLKDQAAKGHEDTKLRIKYECDKEIEETIAQIRRKHEDRLREADAAYLANKNEMETNYNRVFMNRLLSHAFRIKCVGPNPGTSAPSVPENVASSSFSHQHRQSSLPPVTASSLASQPSASQQAMPPPPPPPSTILQQSSAFLSSIPTRPPNINNITPATGNYRAAATGGEFRAPAPHLQRFRPPSMSTTTLPSLQHLMPHHQRPLFRPPPPPPLPPASAPPPQPTFVMPNHQVPINPLFTPLSSSQPLFQPLPPASAPPPPPTFLTNHSRHINNSVPSALQLLFDIDNISVANQPNLLPPLNMSSLNLPETGTAGKQVSSSHSPVPTDIVCLSDED